MMLATAIRAAGGLAVIAILASPAAAQTPHASFHVNVVGKGPAIVLIPGLMSTGDVWDTTVARYQDRYTLHVLTLAGFGGPPAVGEPFLARVRDEVLRYIRDEKLAKPIIVGHSLGGFLAFWIAATAPAEIGALVAVDGVPFLPALGNPAATAEGMRGQAEQIKKLYASFTTAQLVAQTRMALQTMIRDQQHVERALTWAAKSDPAAVGAAVAELMATDLREQVAAITAPTLLIGAPGAAPEAMRPALVKAYAAQMSRLDSARVIMADDARHFVMFDNPSFLFTAIDDFLTALGRVVVER